MKIQEKNNCFGSKQICHNTFCVANISLCTILESILKNKKFEFILRTKFREQWNQKLR